MRRLLATRYRLLLPSPLSTSDQPRALHRVVAVDQLHAEQLRLGVDHQRIARREAVECVAARLFVEVRAGHLDRGGARGQRLVNHLADDALPQAGEEDEMARAQQAQRVRQLGAVLVAEVGHQDDQRPLAMAGEKVLRRRQEVRVRRRRLDVVELSHQRVERQPALLRRKEPLVAFDRAEGHRADGVALLQRDVGQQHHRVQDLVEVRGAGDRLPILAAQPASAIDQEHHTLIPLVLEFADDGLGQPCRRAPVDVAHGIAGAIFRQLLEIGALPTDGIALDADFLQAAVAGEPCIPGNLAEVRIDTAPSAVPMRRFSSHSPHPDRTRAWAGAR